MTSLLAGLLLGSCATNNVASSGLIQKRKHNKGFHLNFPSKVSDRAGEDVADAPKITEEAVDQSQVVYTPSTSTSVDQVSNNQVKVATPSASVNEVELTRQQEKPIRTTASKSTPQESVIHRLNLKERSAFSSVTEAELSKDSWNVQKEDSNNSLFAVELIILVLLAFLLPPLAVYLSEGSWNTRCWISLLLTILFWVPGIIFALYVVLVG